MGVKIGDFGGIRLGEEAVAYGTVAASLVWQHARSSTLGRRAPLLEQPRLSGTKLTTRKYATGYSDGEVEVCYDSSRAVIGPLLAACGDLQTNDYVIGDGGTPDRASLSAQIMHGNSLADGYLTQHLGCVPTHLRLALNPNQPVILTLGLLGRTGTEIATVAPTAPDEAGIVYESDFTALTIGGVAMSVLAASIEQQFQIVGADRKGLATSSLKQPIRTGRVMTTASLTVELANDTGNNSQAWLAAWHAGSPLGDIVIGDFELGSCHMTGEPPALQAGIQQFALTLEASALTITTVA